VPKPCPKHKDAKRNATARNAARLKIEAHAASERMFILDNP
jgi:hypothetical protein